MPKYDPWTLSRNTRFEESKSFTGKDIFGNPVEVAFRCKLLDAIEVATALEKATEIVAEFGGSDKMALPDSSSVSIPIRIAQNICFLEAMQLPCPENSTGVDGDDGRYDFLGLIGFARVAPLVYANILQWCTQFVPGGSEGNSQVPDSSQSGHPTPITNGTQN